MGEHAVSCSSSSDLFFNRSTVESQSGVQQGDPLGLLLFLLPFGLFLTKSKAYYQTSRKIVGIMKTEFLKVPRTNFVKRWKLSQNPEKTAV